MDFLINQKDEFLALLASIPEGKLDYSYAEGKWTLKQSIVHVIETERIFAYRALAASRGDEAEIPGFDQDKYIELNDVSHISHQLLMDDFAITRNSTIVLFAGFSSKNWEKASMISAHMTMARSLPYMIAGHVQHHIEIIKERYLA
jgi:uncharacterized damage-inducible protein DinB